MNWKDRKKELKETEGNLLATRHVIGGVRVDLGACDDHMCDGHTAFFVKCSCGFAARVAGRHDEETPAVHEHRLRVIERHLNLRFAEDDD